MPILNRELTVEEREELTRRVNARKETVQAVRRARIILAASTAEGWVDAARALGCDKKTVRKWVARFEECGLYGLEDAYRSGHPFRYTPEERAWVVEVALTPPADLDLPFGSWTFDRLEAYFHDRGLMMKRSRIQELLVQEGLRWHQEENWIGAKVDPEFLKKRGLSSKHIPVLRPVR